MSKRKVKTMSDEIRYRINAIETRYNGILFRSRLEARWAAMFDLLGWRWTYEPTEFNGWIPDFAIQGKEVVYVEVKPFHTFPISVANELDQTGCEAEILLLGMHGPVNTHFDRNRPMLGFLRDNGCWSWAPLGVWDDCYGFCHDEISFTDRISGKHTGSWGDNVTVNEALSLWRDACNKTRWMPNVQRSRRYGT